MLVAGGIVVIAILATRVSAHLGLPALILFLATGMLAGSEGLGGIWFDDPQLTWSIGVVALCIILFSAGLDTEWMVIRSVLGPGLMLASVGVLVSTGLMAGFYSLVFHRPLGEGFLLGAIISSTDAAAVFSVLRSSGIRLRGSIQPLLEMESGSNDPVAIFIAVAASFALAGNSPPAASVAVGMVGHMAVGLLAGVGGGRVLRWTINRLRVPQEGLYPVFATALAFLLFGVTTFLHGSGFLAVYVAGIVAASRALIHRRGIVRFHDALAWLAQIGMFVLLGLLVFPSRLPAVAGEGLAIAGFLLFVARPVSVLVSLTPFGIPLREQAMVSWVGLRGAVPIVLAVWPRVLDVPGSDRVFDIVFLVVLVSVVMQGMTLPRVARYLGVADEPIAPPIPGDGEQRGTTTIRVMVGPGAEGRSLIDLELPPGARVALLERDDDQMVPKGGTILMTGDVALVMLQRGQEDAVRKAMAAE